MCGLAFVFFKEGADASDDAKTIALKLKAGLNSRANMFLYAAITMGLSAVIFAITVCCNIQHFSRAIKIIDLAADFLMIHTKRVLIVPPVQFILQLIVISIWAGGYASVMSMNDITVDPVIPQGKKFEWSDKTMGMAIFMWVGLFWILVTLDYIKNYVALSASTSYYFNSRPGVEAEGEGADVCLALW